MEEKPLSKETFDTKKPVQSPAPFLSYTIDLLFAALVFIVVLLVTWGLHHLGNTLGITWFRFYWRLFELLVVSFGTLWCVVFVIVEFAKKSKRQFNIVRRFGELCIKQPVSLVVCSLIVFAFLYVGISFAEIVRDDSDNVSILACEILCETGPDFPKSVSDGDILEMLASYSKYLKHDYFPDILRALTDSPAKGLVSASQTMGNIDIKGSQEKVANDIWRAGEEIMLGRLKAPRFLPRGIALHEYREVPEWLVKDVNDALDDSEEAARLFEQKRSLANAVESCEANRKTMLLLFLARSSLNRPEVASLFTRFRKVVKESMDIKNNLAGTSPYDDPRKEFLTIIAQSEQRRLDILDAIEKRDIQKAIELMWDAIEIAYSKRAELLQLCPQVLGPKYLEEITP